MVKLSKKQLRKARTLLRAIELNNGKASGFCPHWGCDTCKTVNPELTLATESYIVCPCHCASESVKRYRDYSGYDGYNEGPTITRHMHIQRIKAVIWYNTDRYKLYPRSLLELLMDLPLDIDPGFIRR